LNELKLQKQLVDDEVFAAQQQLLEEQENFGNLQQKLNEEIEKNKQLHNQLAESNQKLAHVQKRAKKAQATFTYEAEEEDELGFQEGDVIEITKEDASGWWEGTLNGKSGMFPAVYVTVIETE